MDCARTRQDGILVLAVKGRIDATNASEFEVECMAILNKGERQLIFDLSEVVYLSSAGPARVLARRQGFEGTTGEDGYLQPTEACAAGLRTVRLRSVNPGRRKC